MPGGRGGRGAGGAGNGRAPPSAITARMEEPLHVDDGLTLPGSELLASFSRSSGPGGQHANVTASRVILTFDVAGSPTLSETQRRRLLARLGPTVTAVAQDHRSQLRNRELARERMAERLRRALRPVRPRRPTRPGAGAVERRLTAKRHSGERKRDRRPPRADD